jgi:hypothetical protein
MDETLRALDDNKLYRFTSSTREFMGEVVLLEFFRSSPCHLQGEKLAKHSGSPIYNVIPVLWRSLTFLPKKMRASLTARVRTVLNEVVKRPSFLYDLEHWVLVHSSTAALYDTFGEWKELLNHRIVSLTLEGIYGDKRGNTFRPGPRSVVIPYFVDSNEDLESTLAEFGAQQSKAESSGVLPGGSSQTKHTHVLLRASKKKSAGLRGTLKSIFEVRAILLLTAPFTFTHLLSNTECLARNGVLISPY